MRFRGGRFLIGVSVVVTTVLWFLAQLSISEEPFSQDPILYVAQISGGLATVLLSMSFVLATRHIYLEKLFAGLDDVYRVHTKVAKVAFVVMLAHPIAHIVRTFGDFASFALYSLPGNIDYYNYGIYSVYLFTALILLSIYRFLPYNIWKYTHILLGIPFALAIFHFLGASGPASEFYPLYAWYLFWIILGVISYIYKSLIYSLLHSYIYHVEDVIERDETTVDVIMYPDSKPIRFVAGQFAFFSFLGNKKVSPESHPYSFSSAPSEEHIRISVKNLGDHSGKLKYLKKGDKVRIEGPHGQFNADFIGSFKKEIWIAGGVGVTPFISMLHEFISRKKEDTEIYIYYCSNDEEEATYQEEIMSAIEKNSHLHINGICKYTNQDGYLKASDIYADVPDLSDALVMICGPVPMMRALEKQFRERGLPKENITYEEFSFA